MELSCSLDHEFMCVSDRKCIHILLHCDGEAHCHDGSDEVNCSGPGLHCVEFAFLCRQPQCAVIPRTAVLNYKNANCKIFFVLLFWLG